MSYPKETVEAAKALLAVSAQLAVLSKDGVSLTDAVALAAKLNEEPLKSLLAAAQDGANLIPEEVKHIDFLSGLRAVLDIGPDVMHLVESLGKK